MKNIEAKAKSIEKAWSKYPDVKYNSSGFADDIGAKYDIWNGDFEFGVGMHRPKELKGISDNNGWTRIEPDGSNLPVEDFESTYHVCERAKPRLEYVIKATAVKTGFEVGILTHFRKIDISKPIY